MPIGVLANVLCVAVGGWLGSIFGSKLSDDVIEKMNWTFGVSAMSMGIMSVIQMKNMPAVIFSVVVGTFIGLIIHLGRGIESVSSKLMNVFPSNGKENRDLMLTAVVLFCASGTGIYGSLDSGMTGNHTILLTKAILDIFTALIFACSLGKATSLIAVPQLVIMTSLFYAARLIYPLTTETMILDFKACGGIILLATGFRIMKVRAFPIADMIPAMILVMPVSYLWTQFVLPLL